MSDEKNNGFKPTLDYVTAAQGRIFLGGILLDECYDIQYMYKEAKEPIYGYLSKHWDAVLDGTVIIYGSFTINYKHDAYLSSILDKIKGQGLDDSVNAQKSLVKNEKSFAADLKKFRAEQQALQAEKQEAIKLKSFVVQLEATKLMNEEELAIKKLDIDTKIANTKKEKEEFWNSLTPTYQQELNQKIEEFNGMVTGVASLEEVNSINTSMIAQVNNAISAKEGEILTAEGLRASAIENAKELDSKLKLLNAGTNQIAYAETAASLSDVTNMITSLTNRIAQINSELVPLREKLKNVKDAAFANTVAANSEIQAKLSSDPNIEIAEAFELQLVKLNNEKIKIDSSQISDEGYKSARDTLKKKEDEINALTGRLNESKEKLQALKDTGARDREAILAASLPNPLLEEKRPEDYNKFNIMIEYNGSVHKILRECTLLGHSHAIMQSGEPIKEQYQFIAKEII